MPDDWTPTSTPDANSSKKRKIAKAKPKKKKKKKKKKNAAVWQVRKSSKMRPGPSGPVRPVDPSKGLSSSINREWVKKILNSSTKEEIEQLLRDARFPSVRAKQTTSVNMEAIAATYLSTSKGQAELAKEKSRMIQSLARDWCATSEGRRRYEKIVAEVLTDEIGGNHDLAQRSASEKIAKEVDRWMASPRGEAALAEEKRRRLLEAAKDAAAGSSGPNPKGSTVTNILKGIDEVSESA